MAKGYTLIEVLVVISVMTLLTSVLILYNRTSEQHIIIFKEQAKLITLFERAKGLAISTYTKSGAPCAYGVLIDEQNNTIRIFQDLGTTDAFGIQDCTAADNVFTPDTGEDLNPPILESLDSALSFEESPEFTDLVFIPPEPRAVITPPPSGTNASINIILKQNPAVQRTITVNTFGQITAQ